MSLKTWVPTPLLQWYRHQRLHKKLAHFARYAAASGWTTARVPQPHPLPTGRVVVLAAHVDDEAIGCGGTLFLHRQAQQPIHLIYLLSDPRQQAAREAEGQRAAALLGATLTHVRCPRDLRAVTEALAPILQRERPDVIYVPWLLENHEDHLLVHAALGELMQRGLRCRALWCYEVWTPLIPNRIVDITSVLEQKRQLLSIYASQLAQKDLVTMGMGLSHYRGGFLAARASLAAEVFLACSPEEYLAYAQRLEHAPAAGRAR